VAGIQGVECALVAYLSEISEKVIHKEVHGDIGEAEEVDERRIGRRQRHIRRGHPGHDAATRPWSRLTQVFWHIAELLQYDLRLVLSSRARCVLIRHLTSVETLIFYLLPCFLCSKWKFVHVFQEEGECPNLLIGEGRLPRGHAGPANAVFDLPE
jgi:hypothetical protein